MKKREMCFMKSAFGTQEFKELVPEKLKFHSAENFVLG